MKRLIAVVIVLCALPAFACDKPFDVFQNGPSSIIMIRVKVGMGKPLTAEEAKLLAVYEKDEQAFNALSRKTDPVCSDVPDPHNCIHTCKDIANIDIYADDVKAATYREGTMHYLTSPEERAILLKKRAVLEQKWAGK